MLSERARAARLLQVQPTASRAVVEAAYRKLATINHPDKSGEEEIMERLTRRPGSSAAAAMSFGGAAGAPNGRPIRAGVPAASRRSTSFSTT
jgi:hypothetical protein